MMNGSRVGIGRSSCDGVRCGRQGEASFQVISPSLFIFRPSHRLRRPSLPPSLPRTALALHPFLFTAALVVLALLPCPSLMITLPPSFSFSFVISPLRSSGLWPPFRVSDFRL